MATHRRHRERATDYPAATSLDTFDRRDVSAPDYGSDDSAFMLSCPICRSPRMKLYRARATYASYRVAICLDCGDGIEL